MSEPILRRYTNLASALHVIQNRCLTLLSPTTWDDRNDAFYMGEYKRRKEAKSVLALCFANAPETYHHWRVFSHGSDGACIEFDRIRLKDALPNDERIRAGSVNYKTISQAKSAHLGVDDLPFVKRFAFKDESEFRVLYTGMNEVEESKQIQIPLSCISRITLSPWLSSPLAGAVKNAIRSHKGCGKLKVFRSTLIENESWKQLGNPALKRPV